jgi:hypothetical protein
MQQKNHLVNNMVSDEEFLNVHRIPYFTRYSLRYNVFEIITN